VSLHFYNLATKRWLLFKSTAALCYLALTVMLQLNKRAAVTCCLKLKPLQRAVAANATLTPVCVRKQVWWFATLAMDVNAVVKVLPPSARVPPARADIAR
jgi:hypothetical protein